jgi:hypothetical protein
MKAVGLFVVAIPLLAASVMAQTMQQGQSMPETPAPQLLPEKPNALIICAGDVPPENMVITATGTSLNCAGSCRARQVEPLEGSIMVICAGQPIPQYYDTQSITTSPLCNCVGDQDNAYVIRRINGAPTPTPLAPQIPTPPGGRPR